MMNSELLINEPPLQLSPTLAKSIGVNEAIVLQYIGDNPNKSNSDMVEAFPFWSNQTIIRTLSSLEGNRSIERVSLLASSVDEVVNILKQKKPQQLDTGKETCSWCGATTIKLQSHHYPISAKCGGGETVDICANCHFEYHMMVDCIRYKITENGFSLLEHHNIKAFEQEK